MEKMKLNIQLFAYNHISTHSTYYQRSNSNTPNYEGDCRPYFVFSYDQDYENNPNIQRGQTMYKADVYVQWCTLSEWISGTYDISFVMAGETFRRTGSYSQSALNPLIYLFTVTKIVDSYQDGSGVPISYMIHGNGCTNGGFPYRYGGTYYYTPPKVQLNSTLNNIENFVIGNDIPISITKNTNFTDNLAIKIGNTTIKTIEEIESGDNVNFTNLELDTIYGLMPTVNSITFTFELTTYDGQTQIGGISSKQSIGSLTNANPVFTDFDFSDINTITQDILNDASYFIKGYSNLKVSISTANKATAQKGATMSHYSVVLGDISVQAQYSTSLVEITDNSLNAIVTPIIKLYAVDSRGNATEKLKTITNWIDYSKLASYSNSYARVNSVEETTNFELVGLWSNINFKNTANVLSTSYKYKETTSSTWINGTSEISLITNNTQFSFEGHLKGDTESGFEVDSSYNVEITVNDLLSTTTFTYLVGAGSPAGDIYKNNIALGGAYNEDIGGRLQANGKQMIDYSVVEDDVIQLKNQDGTSLYPNSKINRKILYDGGNIGAKNVTLSETSANFDFIELYFQNADNPPIVSYTKVNQPNGKHVLCMIAVPINGNQLYTNWSVFSINGAHIDLWTNGNSSYASNLPYYNSAWQVPGGGNSIWITKVIGYK